MMDQRVTEGEKITFFNKPAFTTTIPAQLALKYDCELDPIFLANRNMAISPPNLMLKVRPISLWSELEDSGEKKPH